jgi:hypothetical protein
MLKRKTNPKVVGEAMEGKVMRRKLTMKRRTRMRRKKKRRKRRRRRLCRLQRRNSSKLLKRHGSRLTKHLRMASRSSFLGPSLLASIVTIMHSTFLGTIPKWYTSRG